MTFSVAAWAKTPSIITSGCLSVEHIARVLPYTASLGRIVWDRTLWGALNIQPEHRFSSNSLVASITRDPLACSAMGVMPPYPVLCGKDCLTFYWSHLCGHLLIPHLQHQLLSYFSLITWVLSFILFNTFSRNQKEKKVKCSKTWLYQQFSFDRQKKL